MNAGAMFGLAKDAFNEWNEDKAPRLAAALAYHTLFSLAPLLVIAISIAGLVFGAEAVRGQVVQQIGGLVGQNSAEMIQGMIAGASKPSTSIPATVIGFATLLLGAAGLFGQLQDALNTIWDVEPKPGQGIIAMIKKRFFSFTMVLGTGFLLLVSLVLSAGVTAVMNYVTSSITGLDVLLQIVNFLVGFLVTALVFAMIFKFIPDADIKWSDVWIGAAVTSLLFSIGRFALGFYLGSGSFSNTYGAAASLVIILLWVFYSAQILFLGAEFTQVYARQYGSGVQPDADAVEMSEASKAVQGTPARKSVEKVSQGKGISRDTKAVDVSTAYTDGDGPERKQGQGQGRERARAGSNGPNGARAANRPNGNDHRGAASAQAPSNRPSAQRAATGEGAAPSEGGSSPVKKAVTVGALVAAAARSLIKRGK